MLDDYQQVALGQRRLVSALDGEVEFFADHLSTRTRWRRGCAPFDVVVAMRERTPFPPR